jgi:hypothetical protein
MNLELLGASRTKLPDRIDATLTLPLTLHFKKKTAVKNSENTAWKAANAVVFNRRGTYAAVGYESGTVAVFDVLSRTLCAIYRNEDNADGGVPVAAGTSTETATPDNVKKGKHGVSFLSWSRRSRSLLVGTAGEARVRLIDTTHPYGPEECGLVEKEKGESSRGDDDDRRGSPTPESSEKKKKKNAAMYFRTEAPISHHRSPQMLTCKQLKATKAVTSKPGKRSVHVSHISAEHSKKQRYPVLKFDFPKPIGKALQVHPKNTCAGIAALENGSLVAFLAPVSAWEDNGEAPTPAMKIATIHASEEFHITCASFDPHGDKLYAATTTGKLLGFETATFFDPLALDVEEMPGIIPGFVINVPGGAPVSQLVVSRNGTNVIINSEDGAIRLYSLKECWTTPEEVDKPIWVFQETETKVQFSCCDFSGDGELVLGAANGQEKKYEFYIWNATTGDLVDKLTGAPFEIHSAAWHPVRSFVAVAASDGLVDLWGSRVNWTAFAPDFQALTENIEYAECEDEFDVIENDKEDVEVQKETEDEKALVDILAVDQVAAFASDSENEEDVFKFEPKVRRTIGLINN